MTSHLHFCSPAVQRRLCLLSLVLVALGWTQTSAGVEPVDAAARGLDIFSEADQRNSGYLNFAVDLQMILRNASGKRTDRALRIRQLEGLDDGDKILVVFDSPANIRGTALLSHGHKTEVDDQWLFLPALNRVKKIASRNKSGPFLGSEFSFEDLSAQEIEKYDYLYLRDEVWREQPCFVVQRIAKETYSGYAKEIFWIDQNHYRTLKIEYYDRQQRPLKVLEFAEYAIYGERYWRAHQMLMQNLRNNKSTELLWQGYQFGVDLDADRNFSVNSLRRAR